eukprot:TRINITY_DN115972_c0_g1_i1.p1 TRINITY_DN115972_c0_g1~~TRINITY_DN115972_c0_g1_i1.p1  ORF type:complete len:227 (+),score=65.78 TRINITY_DN115972_c0_g1_i1:76-681(+)
MGCKGSKSAAGVPARPAATEAEFQLSLERSTDDEVLGLSVIEISAGILGVEAIKEEGLVPTFLKANENSPNKQIKVGDRLVAVNDVKGDTEAMKKELAQKVLVLTVQRTEPAPETTEAPTQAAKATEPTEGSSAAVADSAAPDAAGASPKAGEATQDVDTEAVLPSAAAPEGGLQAVDTPEVQDAEIEAGKEDRLCKMSIC